MPNTNSYSPRQAALIIPITIIAILMAGCSGPKPPGSWVMVDTGTGDAFFSVNFVNERVGWLNGHSDRSYVSPEDENADANKNVSANENANQSAKTDAEDPLKANQGFEVLHTTDGGETWKQIPDQFKYRIRSVWFVDPQTGWALTIDRDILRTDDAGATWTLQRKAGTVLLKLTGNRLTPTLEQPEQIDHLYFVDSMHGWAWGGGRRDQYTEQPGVLLITLDGGRNWNEVAYPFEQNTSRVFFLSSSDGWASTMDGGFYRTADGGLNWRKLQTKLPEDVLRSIFFIDERNGWVAGRSGRLAKTTDGGLSWTRMHKIKPRYKMRDVFFTDLDQGWAVGQDGAILYTADAGGTWVDASAPMGAELLDIVFTGEGAGWVAGLSGAVLKFEPR